MNSPYEGKFKITQTYKGAAHDGLDLVGIDSKEIHATANGKYYHYGHLSQIKVKVGDSVKMTQVIGIEGTTGNSTGNHCHYCVRTSMSPGTHLDICSISGIPNILGGTYDDGYRSGQQQPAQKKTVKVTVEYDDHKYSGLLEEI